MCTFQHLLSPEQYSPPKKMLEFSRKHQEDQVVQEIEDDVKHLTQEQADLEVLLQLSFSLDIVDFLRAMCISELSYSPPT